MKKHKTELLHIKCDGRLWPPSSTSPDTKLEIKRDGRVLYDKTGGGQVGSPHLSMHDRTHDDLDGKREQL